MARRLVDDGHDLVILKRAASDLRRVRDLLPRVRTFDVDRDPLEVLFAQTKPNILLHCATNYGRNEEAPSLVEEANFFFPLKLLELAVAAKTTVFINTDTLLDKRISPYAASKRKFADALGERSSEIVAINVAIEHFFGPDGGKWNFVSRMASDLVSGVDRIALTPGEQRRDFIYIDDVVDAFMTLIQRSATWSKGFYSYQVGTGQNLSIRELMTLLVELSGNKTRLDFGAVAYRPNEVMETRVDISGLTALGWSPKTPFREGLRKMMEAARAEAGLKPL